MDFVSANIGRQFIENPPVTFHSLYEDMTKVTPLVLVLSPGSDPMGAFVRFAKEMDMQDNYQAISLGQGLLSFMLFICFIYGKELQKVWNKLKNFVWQVKVQLPKS